MKRILFISIAIVSLTCSACSNSNYNEQGVLYSGQKTFRIRCIDGVEYLMRASGHAGYMSVHIDERTLKPKRCN